MKVAAPDARRVLGNSAWLVAAEGAARVLSLGTILYLSRTLAPDAMGAVQFGLAVFSVLQLVSIGGVEVLLAGEAARRPAALRELAGRGLVLGEVTFLGAFAVVVAGAWAVGLAPAMRSSAVAFGAAAALVPAALRFHFIGRERARVLGGGMVAGHLAFFGLCVAAVGRPDDVARVAACWLVATAVRTGTQLVAFVRDHGLPRPDVRDLAGGLRRSLALGAGSVARGVVLTVDVLVLGLVRPADEVAGYALAVKLPLFVASLATLFYLALFPTLARAAAAADETRLRRLEAEALVAVLGVTLPGAVCLWWAAEPLTVLLFGERFRDAAPLLALLVWRIPLEAAVGSFRTGLWARRPDADARVSVGALAASVTLLFALAPSGGAWGAAVATLAGAVVALALQLRAGGLRAVALVRAPAAVRIGAAVAVAAALAAWLASGGGPVAVAGALVAWGAGALVADGAYVRRRLRGPAAR